MYDYDKSHFGGLEVRYEGRWIDVELFWFHCVGDRCGCYFVVAVESYRFEMIARVGCEEYRLIVVYGDVRVLLGDCYQVVCDDG